MKRSRLMTTTLAAALSLTAAAAFAQTAAPPPAPPFQQPQQQQQAPDFAKMRAERMAQMQAMRDARRAMMLETRLAGLKAGLALRDDQKAAWTPVEQALRDLAATRGPAHPPGTGMTLTADQRLRAAADRMRQRADGMTKLADALGPLQATFNDDQKLRFQALGRQLMAGGGQMGGMMGGMKGRMQDRMQDRMRNRMGMMDGDHGMRDGRHGRMGMHPGCDMHGDMMRQGRMGQMGGMRPMGPMMGMGGMGGMSGMGGFGGYGQGRMSGMAGMWDPAQGNAGFDRMPPQRYSDMVGMFGMYGWPQSNLAPGADYGAQRPQGWGQNGQGGFMRQSWSDQDAPQSPAQDQLDQADDGDDDGA